MSADSTDEPKPLPDEGLGILADFILHQDSITWTGLSVFVTGELILLGVAVQSKNPIIGDLGIVLVFVSLATLWRSQAYMKAYYVLAKKKAHAKDRNFFTVTIRGTKAFWWIVVLHIVLLVFWVSWTYGSLASLLAAG